MVRRTYQNWLQDIVEWGERIETYIGLNTYDEFLQNRLLQDAVIRCLEVVGEAAGQLMRDETIAADTFEMLDLKGAYAVRNKLIHGYFGAEPPLVWAAAINSVPRLLTEAKRLLDQRNRVSSDE